MPTSTGERPSKDQFKIRRLNTKEISQVLTTIGSVLIDQQRQIDVLSTELEILKSVSAPKKRGRPRKDKDESE